MSTPGSPAARRCRDRSRSHFRHGPGGPRPRGRRVHFIEIVCEDGNPDGLRLPDDVPELEALVEEIGARLLVVDPLVAHLPAEVNSWRDQSVRLALAPLRGVAERRRCAVLVIAHLNKSSSSDPLRRAGGSLGLPGAARSALLLARDPDEPENRRVFAHWKSNLSELAPSLLLELQPVVLPALNGHPDVKTVRLVQVGESEHDGEALLADHGDSERLALDEAVAFLRDELGDGRRNGCGGDQTKCGRRRNLSPYAGQGQGQATGQVAERRL